MRLLRKLLFLVLGLVFVALGIVAVRMPHEIVSPPLPVRHSGGPVIAVPALAPIAAAANTDCGSPTSFVSAAGDNAASLQTLAVSPFGVPETGWTVYAPLIAREIGTACAPQTSGFAASLAAWQDRNAVPASGRMDTAALSKMSLTWLLRRPFVVVSKRACPPSPDEATLAQADAGEAYGGKTIKARTGALAAYRQMLQAARQAPGQSGFQLRIASAYRGPIEEAVRCALGGCGTAGKARCSAHRTGLAFDFYLGAAPGKNAFSTDAANRLYLSQTPTYRWLVNNADRFGFVNYPYEPWHWEWTGEAI
ncbi:MAG: D-alanyl-D-alanine carboxypeptidase family protein [Pseudomonadota bacterium]|nr:D-alanyl-D-alanine carboxypeptidase family protein [Pseudomonadota bacterium]